jgi:hypothetical protein
VTTDIVTDEALHLAAVLAVMNAGLPAAVRAYASDKVPAIPPNEYVAVDVLRRAGSPLRATGTPSVGGWRILARFVSATSKTNARKTRQTVTQAVEGVRFTVAGKTTTPTEFETSDDVAPDDGWWSGLTAWTYAL